MQMEDVLAPFWTNVGLKSEATFAKTGVRRELRRDPHELSKEGLVDGLGDRRDVQSRDDQHVERRAWRDVLEGDHILVLIEELRRQFAALDAAERAVRH